MRFLRLLALWSLAIALIVSFGYSIMIAARAFSTPDALEFKEGLSYVISFWSLGSITLLTICSEYKDRSLEIQRLIEAKKARVRDLGLTEEQARLVEDEFMPVRKKGKKAKIFFYSMAVTCLGLYGFFHFAFQDQHHVLAMYGLVGSVISLGFILAGFAGEINVEIWRFEVFGLHVHEAAVGIFFIIVAVPLLYNGASIDKILALFYLFVGAFLMGRDWKDVASGKIIERIPKQGPPGTS